MKIKQVRFKNFRSYGNAMTVFNIETEKTSSINLIVGKNGSGKTSIENAIIWALYGKVEGVTNSELCNRINKELVVEIDLECGNDSIHIKRGLHPNIFEVKINDKIIDQAGKVNVQDLLEQSYYHIPYAIFKNLIALNINDFKSLLTLTPGEKKGIIDKIFGFAVLNEMAKYVKEDFKDIQQKLNTVQVEIGSVNSSVQMTQRKIEEIKNSPEQKIDYEKIEKIKKLIDETSQNITKNTELAGKIQEAEKIANSRINERSTNISVINSKISELNRKIKLIESGKCPTCGSDLHGESFEEECKKYKNDIIDFENQKNELQLQQKDYNEKLHKLSEKSSSVVNELRQLNSNLVSLRADLKYNESVKDNEKDTSQFDKLINEFENKLNSLKESEINLSEAYSNMQIILKMFADNGIKKYVGSKYTPVINDIINEIGERLQIPYKVRFDDMFDCVITQCGINVKYDTLSSGEKRRLDFTVIVSFLKMLKLQYPSINLLFCDEIFSTLSVDAIPEIISILNDLVKELNLNIFLIHHSNFDSTDFDNVYEVTKQSGFSKIEKMF